MARPKFPDREEVKKQLIDLELSVVEIASKHGISRRMVYYIADEYGINMNAHSRLIRLFSEQRRIEEEIKKLYPSFLAKL